MVEKRLIEIDDIHCQKNEIIQDNFDSMTNFSLIDSKVDGYLCTLDNYSIPYDNVQCTIYNIYDNVQCTIYNIH